jgi:Protein of unknown function (DUF2975)
MRSENQIRLNKIKKNSGILQTICKVLMTMITLGFLAGSIALLINKGGTIRYFNAGFLIGELTLRARFILLALSALTFGIMFKCFFHLHQLLGNYSRAEIFTAGSARQIRPIGHYVHVMGWVEFFVGIYAACDLGASAETVRRQPGFRGNWTHHPHHLLVYGDGSGVAGRE